jgi:hypothetical protein
MRKFLITALAVLLVSLAFVDTSEACGRKKKKPPPPKCGSDTSGSINSAGGGSANVTFGPKSGTGTTFGSNGMTLAPGQGCSCSVAVKKNLGVSASSVTFPRGYPGFSLSTDPSITANTQAFVSHYLTKAGKNPANYDIYVFQTADGVTIPDGVDFNLTVDYDIPAGSDGSELAQDITTLGLFMYDGGEVFAESNATGGNPISLDEYTARDFDLTDAAVFKANVQAPGTPLAPALLDSDAALALANQVCINGGFNCDLNRDGLVSSDDLRSLTGAAVTTTTCAEPLPHEPVPTEPTSPTQVLRLQ